MKPKYYTLTLIVIAFLLAGCRSCTKSTLKTSIIDLETAIEFRNNFLFYPNENYHIPEALMFETEEFEALFNMNGINKIRLYPAINIQGTDYADTLTFIMVPVNENNNEDNFTGYLFEYAKPCPSNCSTPGIAPAEAPTEETLGLNIPKNWCVAKETMQDIIAKAEDKVGADNVYGIRFYWYNNAEGIMDLEIKPTTEQDGLIVNIEGLSFKGVTEICMDGDGCCDTHSPLYQPVNKK